ncbi:MAG: hypothetical protein HY902_15370 [Deltaproteobacteria bacterium]|nr:hypothetical protein [Deltaproteobacteria bacterium]
MLSQCSTWTWRGLPASLTAAIALLACAETAPPAHVADAGGDVPLVCVGPTPPTAAWQAQPGPQALPGAADHTPVVGQGVDDFALPDVQPHSCGYKATYGLKAFVGRPTVVALLAGW